MLVRCLTVSNLDIDKSMKLGQLQWSILVCICFRYEKDVQLFKSKVVDSVKLCNSHLFDQPKIDDPYAIRFVKYCYSSGFTSKRKTYPVSLIHFFNKTWLHYTNANDKLTGRCFLCHYSLDNSFSPWNPAVHEEAKERMFAFKVSCTNAQNPGAAECRACSKAEISFGTLHCACYVTIISWCCLETAWGSPQGNAGVRTVLGEAWHDSTLQ